MRLGLVLFNLTIVAFLTGFAWTMFQIAFVMFFGMLILGSKFGEAFDKL